MRLTLGPSLKVQFRLAPSSEAQLRQEIPIEGRAVELDFGLVQDIAYEMGGSVSTDYLENTLTPPQHYPILITTPPARFRPTASNPPSKF